MGQHGNNILQQCNPESKQTKGREVEPLIGGCWLSEGQKTSHCSEETRHCRNQDQKICWENGIMTSQIILEV